MFLDIPWESRKISDQGYLMCEIPGVINLKAT